MTGGALTRPMQSRILYFINSDGSSARGTCNAVTYIYANTRVLIHSPRRIASGLFITSSGFDGPASPSVPEIDELICRQRISGGVAYRGRRRSLSLPADNYYRRGKRLEINDYCFLELAIWVGPH